MTPEELVRTRAWVRVFDGATGEMVMVEGEVIGYLPRPSLLIRDASGVQSSWSVDLPREVVEPPRMVADACGWCVHHGYAPGQILNHLGEPVE